MGGERDFTTASKWLLGENGEGRGTVNVIASEHSERGNLLFQ